MLLSNLSADYLAGDGSQYLSVTDQLLRGEGATTRTLVYMSQIEQGVPAVQTIWPPGLPLVAAFVASVFSLEAVDALGVVLVSGHVSTALLLLWVLAIYAKRPELGAVFGVAWMAYWGAWPFSIMGMSETVFVALITGAATALAFSRKDGVGWYAALVLAALLMAAAALVRYQVLPFSIAMSVAVLVARMRTENFVRAFFDAGMAAFPAALVTVGLAIRNINVVGSLRGGPEPAAGFDPGEVALNFAKAVYDLLGMEAGSLARACVVIGISAFMVLEIRLWRGRLAHIENPMEWFSPFILFCILGTAFNIAFAILIGLSSTAFDLPPRYLLPSVPLVLFICGIALPTFPKFQEMDWVAKISSATAIVAIILLYLSNTIWELRWFNKVAIPLRSSRAIDVEYKGELLEDVLRRLAMDKSPLMSNQPQGLYAVIRQPTVGVADSNFWADDPDLFEIAQSAGAEYLIAFPDAPIRGNVSNDYVLQFVAEDPSNLTELYRTDLIRIYQFSDFDK
ncbi:MAG: hypothetical protein ACR2O8_00205 [Rhizobiaceae bacterium]